jgi:hypothetical protein
MGAPARRGSAAEAALNGGSDAFPTCCHRRETISLKSIIFPPASPCWPGCLVSGFDHGAGRCQPVARRGQTWERRIQ